MSVYTKTGDRGTTSLANGLSISKSDDRIELLGTIDELNSHIGLAKVLADSALKDQLSHIQRNLMQIMACVADPRNMDYRFSSDETKELEGEIAGSSILSRARRNSCSMEDASCPQAGRGKSCKQDGQNAASAR